MRGSPGRPRLADSGVAGLDAARKIEEFLDQLAPHVSAVGHERCFVHNDVHEMNVMCRRGWDSFPANPLLSMVQARSETPEPLKSTRNPSIRYKTGTVQTVRGTASYDWPATFMARHGPRRSNLRELPGNRKRPGKGDGAAGDVLRQVLAVDQLHHERGDAVTLLKTVDRGDVRMIERGERAWPRARIARVMS
jgi:hypothetical protein